MVIRNVYIPTSIRTKLQYKHHVDNEEIYEVLYSRPKLNYVERGHIEGENLYRALGKTDSGRHLAVFFIYKKNKNVIIISARDMTRKERRYYVKK